MTSFCTRLSVIGHSQSCARAAAQSTPLRRRLPVMGVAERAAQLDQSTRSPEIDLERTPPKEEQDGSPFHVPRDFGQTPVASSASAARSAASGSTPRPLVGSSVCVLGLILVCRSLALPICLPSPLKRLNRHGSARSVHFILCRVHLLLHC